MRRRRLVRVPASSANLGPGFDCVRVRARAAHGARGRGDRALRGPHRPADRARPAQPRACAAFARLPRPTPSPSGSGRRSRSAAGWARARRPTSPGSWPPTTSSSSTPTCSRWPPRSRATRTTSRPRCTAASSSAPTARRRASSRRTGLEAVLVVPRRPVRTQHGARGAARAGRRWPTRCSTSRTARCSSLGLARGRLGPGRARSRATACTSRAARTSTRARWSSSRGARELGALGATISGAGPTVLVWCHYEATGGRRRGAARARPRAGREVMRVPFESAGRRRARALS